MDNLQLLSQLHFLRPYWLLLALPIPFIVWALKHSQAQHGLWARVIDPLLQPFMLSHKGPQTQLKLWPLWGILWLVAVVALAGPSFRKLPQPVSKNQQALIIMLDMSASMAAEDIKPSRATRAIQKITDIIRTRRDGVTALVVYSGDAHIVTPLTDDTRTIETLLPALSPFIMPAPGSRPDKAVKLARELANNAGINKADLLLLTDGIIEADIKRIKHELRPGLNLSVLGIGTEAGAPIPLPTGGFLRDGQNNIVIPGLTSSTLNKLSHSLQLPYQQMRIDDSDWQSMLNQTAENVEASTPKQQFDLWRDEGFWFIFLLLPGVLLCFRRGVLLCIPLLLAVNLLMLPAPSHASIWQTPNQQAAQLFTQDPQAAAEMFTDKAWQGSAYYQAGDYQQAIQALQQAPKDATNLYNLANALAQDGQYQAAINAYAQALQLQPDFPQAQHNKKIVEDALQQQEEQSADSDSGDSNDAATSAENKQNQPSQPSQPSNDNSENGAANQPQQHGQNDTEPAAESHNATEAEDPTNTDQTATPTAPSSAAQADDSAQSELSREEQEAIDKWLRQVPDNPGNLLQRKFLYQYKQQDPAPHDSGEVLW